ncbi:MAG: HAMP domain-containing sensor histidine kinase [Actinomycetes bacterium]
MSSRVWVRRSLRSRLLTAFLVVALSSVAVVAVAAMFGIDRGLDASNYAARQQAAESAAQEVAMAYQQSGGWSGVNLNAANVIATSAGARMLVSDASGGAVFTTGGGQGGMGMGLGAGGGPNSVSTPVVVDGVTVGQVRLGFGSQTSTGRGVAWTWIIVATVIAVVLAVAVAWFVSRRISAPLQRLTLAARAFSAGDRTARAGVTGPGEIGELGRAFDQTADQVARTETARRNLAADIAHELRTPLTVLQAELEELRDGLLEADEEVMARLHEQSMRMGRIVNDLADLADAEAATLTMTMRPVSLAELVTEELHAHDPAIRAAGLSVVTNVQDDVTVQADPDRIGQAIGNVLTNATKYCRPGDTLTLAVEVDGSRGLLTISDTGPGIAPTDLPRVFDRMWRGPDQRDSTTGSGIGLAVARQIVERSGGTITAESDGTHGTTFTIALPRSGPMHTR